MTNYELEKLSVLVTEKVVAKIKGDSELLDLMCPPKWMNIEEASKATSIPIGTLYAKASEIPHMKVGKRLVFTDRGLMRWMMRNKAQ